MNPRRAFLVGAASLLAMAGLQPDSVLAQGAGVLSIDEVSFATGLSQAKFKALLNQTFYLHTENDGVLALSLIAVEERATPTTSEQGAPLTDVEQFSLTFRGPALPAMAANLYRLEHWLAGSTGIYLEPDDAQGSERRYRALFALLR